MITLRSLAIFLISLFTTVTPLMAEPIPYKIGVIVPLSGDFAFVGEDIRKGLLLGVQKATNIAPELFFEDSQLLPKQASTAAQFLVTQKHVDALISLWDTAEAVAPIAERAKTLHLSIRWNPHVAERYHYTFTIESTYRSYVNEQLRLLQHQGVKTISVIHQISEGWDLSLAHLKQEAPRFGITVNSVVEYTAGTKDFSSLTTKALTSKPDSIVINGWGPELIMIIKKIKELSPSQRFTGYFDGDPHTELFEGQPYISQFSAKEWFKTLFKNRYGEEFKTRAPQAYDTIVLLDVIHQGQSKKLSGEALIESLKKVENLVGASGTFSAHGGKTFESDTCRQIVRDGKVQTYSD